MLLLWCVLFFGISGSLSFNISREYVEHLIKTATPGVMELDPNFQHIFQNKFINKSFSSHIAGGWESELHSKPFQAGIYVPTPIGSSFCGGSLISTEVVLTAAHCVMSANGVIVVYLGAHRMPPSQSERAVLTYSMEHTIHPEWNPQTIQNDVALLYLWEPVVISDRIKPIPLPLNVQNTFLGRPTTVSGWGRPGDAYETASPVLMEVTSRVISNVACRLAYLSTIQRTNLCTSGEGSGSTCRGNSGGPLVIDGILVGVVSFGSSLGCEVDWPPVHTRVTSYVDWITSNLLPPSTEWCK